MCVKVVVDNKILEPRFKVEVQIYNVNAFMLQIDDEVKIEINELLYLKEFGPIKEIECYIMKIEKKLDEYKKSIKKELQNISILYDIEKNNIEEDKPPKILVEFEKMTYIIWFDTINISAKLSTNNELVNINKIRKINGIFEQIAPNIENIFNEYEKLKNEIYNITEEFLKELDKEQYKIHIR